MVDPHGEPLGFRFPVHLRLRQHRDFERILSQGLRVGDHRLTVWAQANGLNHPRLGLIVGAKHGNAVRRNRLKRILREAFRLSRPRLPAGLDLVCSPRVNADISLDTSVESLTRLAERLARRLLKHKRPDD